MSYLYLVTFRGLLPYIMHMKCMTNTVKYIAILDAEHLVIHVTQNHIKREKGAVVVDAKNKFLYCHLLKPYILGLMTDKNVSKTPSILSPYL